MKNEITAKGNIFNNLVSMFGACTTAEKEMVKKILAVRYGQGIYIVMNWANEGGDPEYAYTGFDLEEARQELAAANRVEGFEHINQTWLLLERIGDDDKDIESKEIPAINNSTDDILADVRTHFGGKYTSHTTADGTTIELRIADHSGKHRNITADKCISIVIANDNATEHFVTSGPEGIRNEHYFTEDNTAEEIIAAITAMLLEEGCIEE